MKVIVPITDWKDHYLNYPWMVKIDPSIQNGLSKLSAIDCFQICCVSVERLIALRGTAIPEIVDKRQRIIYTKTVEDMDQKEKFQYWVEHAKYDMDTAVSMSVSGRWFYVVFMCQQAIEKLVKGLYTLYIDDNVPHIHNIQSILDRFADKLPATIPLETSNLCNVLSGYYISNRYPDFENKPEAIVNRDMAEALLKQTREVFTWLLTLSK